MPYQHCPGCRLTVHVTDQEALGGPCPRCGAELADEPRSLFAQPASTLTPDAVRTVLAQRGGRSRRDEPVPRQR